MGLWGIPPSENRAEQSGFAQTVSEFVFSIVSTVCRLSKTSPIPSMVGDLLVQPRPYGFCGNSMAHGFALSLASVCRNSHRCLAFFGRSYNPRSNSLAFCAGTVSIASRLSWLFFRSYERNGLMTSASRPAECLSGKTFLQTWLTAALLFSCCFALRLSSAIACWLLLMVTPNFSKNASAHNFTSG